MQPLPLDLNLQALRTNAKISQKDLAARLGIDQSQVARYEKKPDNVPLKILRQWIEACGYPRATEPFDVGSPYASIQEQIETVRAYARRSLDEAGHDTALASGDTMNSAILIGDLLLALGDLGRPPRLLFRGRYDSGKSRLANALLGGDFLPTGYQPVTRLPCLVRHRCHKPDWQREDVFVMGRCGKEYFRFDQIENREAFEKHRLLSGDLETLRRFGTKPQGATPIDHDYAAVVVYLEAPLLLACDLIDTPGAGNASEDDALTRSAMAYADAVAFLSPFQNFLNRDDIRALNSLMDTLPEQHGQPPFRSLAILATHCHPGIETAGIDPVLDTAAQRLHNAMSRACVARGQPCPPLSSLRARFFPWYVETPGRRAAFEADLRDLLGTTMPHAIHRRLDKAVASFQAQADQFYLREAAQLRATMQIQEEEARQADEALSGEPERSARIEAHRQSIEATIDAAEQATADFIRTKIAQRFEHEAIADFLEQNYAQAKSDDAEKAVAELWAEIGMEVETFLRTQAEPLEGKVNALLEEFSSSAMTFNPDTKIPFDARAAFLGALSGAGAFAGLAGWAAAVAGGSSLGAYILVTQAAGLLARLGIGLAGGTATGVSIVAALGGPVAVGAGIAASLGVLAYHLFGRSWQSRLATQLATAAEKEGVVKKIAHDCSAHWEATRSAFRHGFDVTEREHAEYLDILRARRSAPTASLRQRLARLESYRAYLSFIPWSPLKEAQP